MSEPVNENEVELSKKLAELETYKDKLFAVGKSIFNPGGVGLLISDLFIVGVLKKALSILFGFTTLMREKNYVAAAPLVRIHIDTLLRLHAMYLSQNMHDFATKVINDGISISSMKDKDGQIMRDGYLARNLSKAGLTWLKPLYDEMCGFVHLSDKHVWSATRFEGNIFSGIIGSEDYYIPIEQKTQAVDAMIAITAVLVHHLDRYVDGVKKPQKA